MITGSDIDTIARDLSDGRKMKEAFWGLIGSVQNPVENPVRNDAKYSARIGTKDGVKIARLTLTFETPE